MSTTGNGKKDLNEMQEEIDEKIKKALPTEDIFNSYEENKYLADEIYHLTIPASIDSLEEVLAFVNDKIQTSGGSVKTQMQLDIAIEELFVNIAHYAYDNGTGDADIFLQITDNPKAITVEFRDSGKPFNPLERMDPDTTLSAADRNIGGLGIYMAKKSVDEIEYRWENGQNILTICKYL